MASHGSVVSGRGGSFVRACRRCQAWAAPVSLNPGPRARRRRNRRIPTAPRCVRDCVCAGGAGVSPTSCGATRLNIAGIRACAGPRARPHTGPKADRRLPGADSLRNLAQNASQGRAVVPNHRPRAGRRGPATHPDESGAGEADFGSGPGGAAKTGPPRPWAQKPCLRNP